MFGISALSRLSLQRRLALVVAVSLLGIFASFAYLGNQALSESTDRTLQERLFLAQMAAAHFDAMLSHGLEELGHTTREIDFNLEDGDLEPEKRILRDIFPQLVIFSHNVFILDKDGKVLWVEPYDAKLVGSNLARQVDIAKALQGEKPHVSNLSYVFYTFSTDKPVVLLTVPVKSRDGRITGLLGGAVDLNASTATGFVEPIRIGDTGRIQLVDERGMVLVGNNKESAFKKWRHADMVRGLMAGESPSTMTALPSAFEGFGRSTDILAFAPLRIAPWGVGVEQDVNEAFAPTRNLQVRLALLAGMTLAVATAVTTVSARSVIRPVRELTKASQAIAAGDLATPIHVSAPDELGVLARSFDTMRQELHQSRAEIERWNKELEDRVRQRTRELSAMFEVSQIVASTLKLETLLSTVLVRIVSLLQPADVGAIFLVDPATDALVARAVYAARDGLLETLQLRVGQGLPPDLADPESGVCCSAGELTEWAGKAREQEPVLSTKGLLKVQYSKRAVCIPLVSRDQTIGCLFLMAVESVASLTDSDLRLCQALADQVAVAIENAHLVDEASMVEALRKADRLKTEFISTVSHELRTPLASVKGYTSTLLRDDANWDVETQKEFLQIIDDESDKLRELIDNLLEMSKMEAGFLTIEKQPILIPKIAAQSVAEMVPRTTRHTFEVDFPSRFPVVEADARRIEQILHNLLENAVKYSPDGGSIRVQGIVAGDFARVTVTDRGIGMAPEEVEKIFDRFYRGDHPLTKRTAGSGLGLAIAKGLVEAQGGRIWVESKPGEGSSFHFTLPLGILHPDESEQE